MPRAWDDLLSLCFLDTSLLSVCGSLTGLYLFIVCPLVTVVAVIHSHIIICWVSAITPFGNDSDYIARYPSITLSITLEVTLFVILFVIFFAILSAFQKLILLFLLRAWRHKDWYIGKKNNPQNLNRLRCDSVSGISSFLSFLSSMV